MENDRYFDGREDAVGVCAASVWDPCGGSGRGVMRGKQTAVSGLLVTQHTMEKIVWGGNCGVGWFGYHTGWWGSAGAFCLAIYDDKTSSGTGATQSPIGTAWPCVDVLLSNLALLKVPREWFVTLLLVRLQIIE